MNSKTKLLPIVYCILGLAGCWLYRWIFTNSVDESSLVLRGSWAEIVLWVITAAAIVGACLICRKAHIGTPNAIAAIVGNVLLSAGIFSLLQGSAKGPEMLVLLYRVFCWASIVSLLAGAVMHILGKEPFFLLHIPPCVLMVLHLVECYQLWSEKPLLLDYFFGVGAILLLTLYAYHKMEHASKLPEKKLRSFSCILGIFFCCVAAMQVEFPIFFASGALWLLMDGLWLTTAEE